MHSVRRFVLIQLLIVFTQSNTEELFLKSVKMKQKKRKRKRKFAYDCSDILEAVHPFLSFASLTANIDKSFTGIKRKSISVSSWRRGGIKVADLNLDCSTSKWVSMIPVVFCLHLKMSCSDGM
jgi:hypothetical protein